MKLAASAEPRGRPGEENEEDRNENSDMAEKCNGYAKMS
jgi:hypothetical protein